MGLKRKILLVGDTDPSGRLLSFQSAFHQAGCECQVLDSEKLFSISLFHRLRNRLSRVPQFGRTPMLERAIEAHVKEFSPDVVMFFKPIWVGSEFLQSLRRYPTKLWSWFPDDIFYWKNGSEAFYKAIPEYDLHLPTKTFNVAELKERGAKSVLLLPHAIDCSYHYPYGSLSSPSQPVSFVGTWSDDKREEYLEALVRKNYQVSIYGNDWQKVARRSLLRRKAIQNRAVYGRQFASVVADSKISLSFLRAHNRDRITTRTLEIPAMAGFMLHERSDEACEIFKEGVEAEYFGSLEECEAKILYYLKHDAARARIAKQGYARACRFDLSYDARVKVLLEQG